MCPSFSMLFEGRQRTRKEPLKHGESLWEFYDSCTLAGYDEFRSVINQWLAEMPEKDRQDLVSRMKYGGNRQFGACLCELSVHAFLIRSGFRVAVHPEIPGTTKQPDFVRSMTQVQWSHMSRSRRLIHQTHKKRKRTGRTPSTTRSTARTFFQAVRLGTTSCGRERAAPR